MNEHFTNVIAGLAAALTAAYFTMELTRRRRQLRALYDVLGKDDRHICIALEAMVADGTLSPWAPESPAP